MDRLKLIHSPLFNFTRESVTIVGTIRLAVTFGTEPHQTSQLYDSLNALGWINQSPYLVSVHGIHFRFHGIKPFPSHCLTLLLCRHLVRCSQP